ncbi:GEVED domain-containing protein [Shewanella marina]|uniref:GEVED domain-containing protein n=1 Tax=Shewanella marina TaxID=487319 RepID=UPI000472F63A|nr:GEVED domain-containing protein [Shewanella marina]
MASNGEVEDYLVQIGGADLGDLPDTANSTSASNYRTNLAHLGPYHNVAALTTLYIGDVAPDVDGDTTQSSDALFDDDNGSIPDDEEGFIASALPVLAANVGYQAKLTLNNASGSDAYLYAWIDWDRDGSFESDELIQSAQSSLGSNMTITDGVMLLPASTGSDTYLLSWNNDTATSNNSIYGVRLRLTSQLLTDNSATTTVDERSLGAAADGEVEDYLLTARNSDFGDAPDSYQTLPTSNGAVHYYVSNLYLGANNIDDDDVVLANADASGDDSIGDDENGVVQPLPLIASGASSYSVDVAVYNYSGSPATLIAWLDLNQDGQFSADEAVDKLNVSATGTPFSDADFASNNLPTSSNNLSNKVTLTWNAISGLSQGNMALRIRVANSSLTINDWAGEASGGEVEDYMVYVGSFDFGDAADASAGANSTSNYHTRLTDSGPYHGLSTSLFMGAAAPDVEADSYNSTGAAKADGDDLDINGDDEDAVTLAPLDNSPVPSSYSVKVNVTNTGSTAATLYGWIDWDRNGHFDGDEATTYTVNAGTHGQLVELTWTSFTGITAGETVARFRLTTDALTNSQTNMAAEDTRSIGGASDGEVEDHSIYIGNQDLGDAPDSYQTLINNNGPFHGQGKYTTLYLGNTYVNENDTDGMPTADASGDDNTGSDDEQGINQPLSLLSTAASSYSVNVKFRNGTGRDATVIAWLDKNQNGKFSADEVVDLIDGSAFVVNNVANGANFTTDTSAKAFVWNNLSGLAQGNMALRVRIANQPLTANDWAGAAITGEVEDYMVYVGEFDFGDAADNAANANSTSNHRTTLSDNGPYHGLSSSLFMGAATPDAEADSYNSTGAAAANGDDDDANGDDEDGVTLAPLDNSPVPSSYTVKVNVTNSGTNNATLYGWIDWDRNGRFDGDEAATVTVAAGTTAQQIELTWTSFTSISAGDTVARFRLTTDALTNAQTNQTLEDSRSFGGASDGEVEDHTLYIGNQDLGDAPDSYQTLTSNNGPFHGQGKYTTLYLGNTYVNEGDTDGMPTADASGDDNTGSDDEQGVNQPLALTSTAITSYSVDLKFRNSTGSDATLVAWLDKNQDGQFSSDEVVDLIDGAAFASNNVPNNSNFTTDATAKTLTWNGLTGLTQGAMALRIRIANQALTANDWAGMAITGEVEDYMVFVGGYDFGDAADNAANANSTSNYRTTLSDGGPYHGLSSDLFIGAAQPDIEVDSYNSTGAGNANGDDIDANGDDEEGVQLSALDNSPLPISYLAKVRVTNNTSSDATLYGWVDSDRNGHFDEDEVATQIISANSGDQFVTLTWPAFSSVSAGQTVARFRLTTDPLINSQTNATLEDTRSIGGASDGEVEDHSLYIGDHDFGDAPDSYQTLTASQGPAHGLLNKTTLYLGTNNIDAEVDGQVSGDATGDDATGDDENALPAILPIINTSAADYTVTINLRNSTTSGQAATLVAWLDSNQDGSFSADEVVDLIDYDGLGASTFSSDNIPYNSADKSVTLTWNGLSGLTQGAMALRLRLSKDSLTANDWHGVASNGEVEDYLLLVGAVDYGDAPDTGVGVAINNYRTNFNDNGARHITSSTLFMGATATDAETDAVSPNIFALGDDNDTADDENGISFGPLSTTQTEFNATATVTNSGSNGAYIYAWIDFDRNGRFDRDEFISNGDSNSGGAWCWHQVSWIVQSRCNGPIC